MASVGVLASGDKPPDGNADVQYPQTSGTAAYSSSNSVMTPPSQSLEHPPQSQTNHQTHLSHPQTHGKDYSTFPTSAPVQVVNDASEKSIVEAYLLWFVVGILGGHHFYLNRPWYGVAYFFTFGLGGIGWFLDMFRMPCLVQDSNLKRRNPEIAHHRSVMDAYVLWFPLGLLGFHLFYLRKPGQGILYKLTLGLFGLGWLVDLFRIPSMVKQCNEMPVGFEPEKTTCNSYMFWLVPVGFMGGHHFYLRRYVWGAVYFFTLGLGGFGWLADTFRLPILTRRSNEEKTGQRDPRKRYVDDAYVLWFPLGIMGFHHFYLRRYAWGTLYFFTLGMAFIGWIVDLFRIPFLVKAHNDMVDRTPLLLTDPAVSAPAQDPRGHNQGIADGSGGSLMVNPTAPVMPSPASPGGVYPGYPQPPAYDQPPGSSLGAGYQGGQQEPPPSYEETVKANKN